MNEMMGADASRNRLASLAKEHLSSVWAIVARLSDNDSRHLFAIGDLHQRFDDYKVLPHELLQLLLVVKEMHTSPRLKDSQHHS